jgi:tRNA pseudouridine38-40 synthase
MKRYLIKFSYDGSNFNGFQKQKHVRNTVEENIEKALYYINNKTKTKLVASGRTDKKVHALSQMAHFDLDVNITENKLKMALNSLLRDDIHIIYAKEVDNDFHARYMVKKKTYIYKINMGEYNPIERNYVYQLCKELDFKRIDSIINKFEGTHDFSFFCSNEDKKDNCIRTIYNINYKIEKDIVTFSITGNGFLRNMVRIIVGYIVAYSLNKENRDVLDLFNEKRRSKVKTINPEGLYLENVEY